MSNRFVTACLYGKLANIFADLKNDKLANTGLFKMLVSGDPMKAEKKHCQPFDFENYAKLFFSVSEDISYAYFRRWIIFFFENVFEGDKRQEISATRKICGESVKGRIQTRCMSKYHTHIPKLSSRILSHALSNLPLYLSIHSFET